MADKEFIDSNFFDALAYGVFTDAPDTDSGRAALLNAYHSYNWSDPAKAKKTLEEYGELIQHKNKDQSLIPDIENSAPVRINEIPIEEGDGDVDLYHKWVKANTDYLDSPDLEPQFAVAKSNLKRSVEEHGKDAVRRANTATQKERFGEAGAAASDMVFREVRGLSSFVSPVIKKVTGYDLNSYLTEYTDPERDQNILSKIGEGLGNVASIVTAPNQAIEKAAIYIPGIKMTADRYSDTLEKTGDSTEAIKAGALEGASQLVQTKVTGSIFGKAGREAVSGTRSVARNVGLQGAVASGGRAISNTAGNIETQKEQTFDSITEGVGESYVVGGGLAGFVGGVQALSQSRANSNIRSQELDLYGDPITKTAVQKVGPLAIEGRDSLMIEYKPEFSPSRQPIIMPDSSSGEPILSYSTDATLASDYAVYKAQSEKTSSLIGELTRRQKLIGTYDEAGQLIPKEGKEKEFADVEYELNAAQGELSSHVDNLIKIETEQQRLSELSTRARRFDEDGTPQSITPHLDAVPLIKGPAFITEQGTRYNITENGLYVPDGQLPHDRTVFLGEEQAVKVKDAFTNGEHVFLNGKGEPIIEKMQEDGTLTQEPIEYQTTPSKESYPLSASEERSPNAQQKVRSVQLGGRVRDIKVDTSMGAADAAGTTIRQKESTYSERLRKSAELPDEMQDVGRKGIFYTPVSHEGMQTEAQAISRGGIDNTIKAIKDPNVDPVLRSKLENELHNDLVNQIEQAKIAGDSKKYLELTEKFKEVAPLISASGTKTAQSLALRAGKVKLDPIRARQAYDSTYDASIITKAGELGIKPTELAQSDKVVESLDAEIKVAKEEVAATEAPSEKATKQAKVEKLTEQKTKAEKIAKKKEEAIKEAFKAAEQATQNQKRAIELKKFLEDNPQIGGSQKKDIDRTILELESANERSPQKRGLLFSYWVANQIGGGVNAIISAATGVSESVLSPVKNAASDVLGTVKSVSKGQGLPAKSQAVDFVKGLTDKEAWERAGILTKIAWKTGKRAHTILPREEITVRGEAPYIDSDVNDITVDYNQFIDSLKTSDVEGSVKKLALLTAKSAKALTNPMLKLLASSEAIVRSVYHEGFQRASAAHYYNKAKADKVSDFELNKYIYNPKENWAKAKELARQESALLKEAGIEVSKEQESFTAIEKYQEMVPREVQVSAYQQATQLVANGPAAGYAGLVSDTINDLIGRAGIYGTPLKFLAPFSNSIAHITNIMLPYTPFGFVDVIGGAHSKRTLYERQLLQASAIMGTVTGVGVLSMVRNELNKDPTKEPFFSVIGKYSEDPRKVAAFKAAGGQQYSFKVGDTYLPLGENPLALWGYGIGAALDKVRDGKDPDAVTSTVAMHGAFTMAGASIKGLGQMNMLRGVTSIWEAAVGLGEGRPNAEVELVRAIAMPFKGFIPAASLARSAARYFDNPVEARKDIMSAIVEGVPGLQSAYGRPALNIFGEPLKAGKDADHVSFHRLFSIGQSSDLDVQWMSDNGYQVPSISNMQFSKKLQALVDEENKYNAEDAKELDYEMKYKVMQAASPDLREVVGKYRTKFGGSAYNPAIQKALSKDFNNVLNMYKVKLIKE